MTHSSDRSVAVEKFRSLPGNPGFIPDQSIPMNRPCRKFAMDCMMIIYAHLPRGSKIIIVRCFCDSPTSLIIHRIHGLIKEKMHLRILKMPGVMCTPSSKTWELLMLFGCGA